MTKISGVVFLAIGLFMGITSLLLGSKMKAFIYLGVIMIVFGLLKMLFESAGKDKKQKPRTQQPAVKYCPRCNSKMPGYANFCFNCGTRV